MNKKEVKKAPTLRFKGFTNDWELHKLDEIVKFYGGLTYHPENIQEDGTLVLRSSNIHNNQIVLKDTVHVSPEIVNTSNVNVNDIIVVVRNGSRKLIGKHARVLKAMPNTVIGAFMTGIRSQNSKFVNALFDGDIFQREIYKNLGATINQITIKSFKEMEFYIPQNHEKQIIGNLISQIDNLLALQQRKLKLLRTLKSGLSFKLFNKKHLNNLSQISLDQIGQTYSGLTGKSKKDFGHGHAFYVSYLNVNQNEIGNPKQIDRIEIDKKQNLVQKNDIFFTISSETPEEVGLTSLWPVSCKNLYLNSFCFGFRINTKMFIPLYLGYLFRSEYFREKVLPLAQGISRYNLSKNNVLKIKIGQEEIAIQEKYAKVMNDLDSDILRQKKKVKELKLCKKFLLQNMFI